jgi:hypothetical protein
MTIIELNIAGYHVTHDSRDFRAFTTGWLHGWRSRRRKAVGGQLDPKVA